MTNEASHRAPRPPLVAMFALCTLAVTDGCLITDKEFADWINSDDAADSGYSSDDAADSGYSTGHEASSGQGSVDSGYSTGNEASSGQAFEIESCDWSGWGLCIEFRYQIGVESWCEAFGQMYDIDTVYAENGCDATDVGTCEGLTRGDFGSLTATGYFYPEFPDDPDYTCQQMGGDYSPA